MVGVGVAFFVTIDVSVGPMVDTVVVGAVLRTTMVVDEGTAAAEQVVSFCVTEVVLVN